MPRRSLPLTVQVIRDPSPIDLAAWVERYARAVLQLEGEREPEDPPPDD